MLHLRPHPEWHPVLEALAYAIAFALYRRLRAGRGDALGSGAHADAQRWSIIAAAAVGALAGSRLLGLLEQAPRFGWHWHELLAPTGGKTIVGGLLGGWAAVELIKRVERVRTRTGDLFALPLCVGIAIGRIGCLLAGLADDTYGTPTRLPWAVDFGDGIPRHPTQAYEIVFLAALACVLWWLGKRPHANGSLFRVFMAAYLTWRLAIDFLKPQPLVAGLNWIQWACVGGLAALAVGALRPSPAAQNSTGLAKGAVRHA